jgi:hypothetical protein
MELKQLISNTQEELDNPSINRQRKRHLTSFLEELLLYQERHPNVTIAPTALELYCDSNPNASECKIYDD